MATKYTLQLNGYVLNNITSMQFIPSRLTYLASAALDELIAGKCASEDSSGLVALTPDGVLLDQVATPVVTLDQTKTDAYNAIDTAAGVARSRYLTIAPGQEVVYMAKSVQANAYKSAGYDFSHLSDYLWIIAECNSQGADTTDATAVQKVVDGILATEAAWSVVGSKIEQIRLGAKIKIAAETGTTADEIQKAKTNIAAEVADAVTQLEAV